jgi:hypothetical protein
MPVRLTERQRQLVGAMAAALFGFGLAVAGGRLIAFQYLLAEPARVSGLVVSSGRTQMSRSGNVNFVRYEFVDQSGKTRGGTSSGYSGNPGDAILVEYAPGFPSVHRVAGEGRTTAYKWRWLIAGAGLFFLVAGMHWGWSIRSARRPPGG